MTGLYHGGWIVIIGITGMKCEEEVTFGKWNVLLNDLSFGGDYFKKNCPILDVWQ